MEKTIYLLNKNKGNIASISIRSIANKAGIGIGQINYHFQTKENLIQICINLIIDNIIKDLDKSIPTSLKNPIDQLKYKAKLVMDVFFNNPYVFKILLSNELKYSCKEEKIQKIILYFKKTVEDFIIPEKDQLILSFAIFSIIQAIFQNNENSKRNIGKDLKIKKERDIVIELIIDNIFGGYKQNTKRKENQQ